MKDNIIQLNKSDILRLKIVGDDGKETGEFLEFDLEDIDLPIRYQEMMEIHKKNHQNLKNKLTIIDKRQDIKGKKLLSKNQEDTYYALKEYFTKEKEVLDMFLGQGGVDKLLNGRALGWVTLQEISDIIEKQIGPKLKINMETITNKIKDKYKVDFDINEMMK